MIYKYCQKNKGNIIYILRISMIFFARKKKITMIAGVNLGSQRIVFENFSR